MQIKKNTSIPR